MGVRKEIQLKRKRWTTVASHLGVTPDSYTVEMWSPRRCKWRRLGLVPGYGEFRDSLDEVSLWNGILQIRAPESRTCVIEKR